MPLKILHTGDLHLGMTFSTRGYPPALRQELVKARFCALEGLVQRANRENCQLILIAGDLFHRTNVSQETVLKALKALQAFQGACVAVLPGNHDYYDGFSPLWKFFRDNSPDHLVFLGDPAPYSLADYGLDAALYPGPCDAMHARQNRISWIRELSPGARPRARWHLGVAHGALKGVSPDFDSRYYPMELDELQDLRMDHWFLGHAHIRYPDRDQIRKGFVTYSGTPEPDGFDCSHGGFAWLTTLLDEGGGESHSLYTGRYHFHAFCHTANSLEDLKALAGELARKGPRALVKLSLSGALPREDFQGRLALYRELEEALGYLEVEDSALTLRVTRETINAEFSQGSFPQIFLTRLAERGDGEALQLAYNLVKKVKRDD